MKLKNIALILVSLILVTSIVYVVNLDAYHIYKLNCKLTSFSDRCNYIVRVNEMTIDGDYINETDLNKEDGIAYLEEHCNQLTEDTWGCKIFLVIYE